MVLVARCDERAYAMLVQRHGYKYLAFAERFLGNRAEAEDALQDAFLKVWSRAGTFHAGKAKFTTWFYRILLNRCLDIRRKATPGQMPEGYDAMDEREGADQRLYRLDGSSKVRMALATLPDKQRTAVALCYFQGLSNRDAAAVLDVNVKALESLLVRARSNLRDRLAHQKASLLGPL